MMFGGSKKGKGDTQGPPRFLDSKKDGPSRAKHLKFALEERSVHDRRLLLETHSFEIFHLFHELIAAAELNVPSSGGRYSDVEIECALWLLEQVLTYLPDKIAQKWQFNAIGNAFKQCLHPHNGVPLRKIAVRLFLLWYQVLGAAAPDTASTLDPIFAVLVPYLPLPSGASSLKLLEDICSNFGSGQPYNAFSASVSASSQGWMFFRNKPLAPPTNSEKTSAANLLQTFMEKLLESIAKDCKRLEWYSGKKEEMHRKGLKFLLTKLRKYYIDLCWPDMATDGVSFSSKSSLLPTDLGPPRPQLLDIKDPWIVCRFCLVRWVYQYAFSHRNISDSMNDSNSSPDKAAGTKLPHSYETIRNALLEDLEMTCLTLSILREGLLLPFQCHAVMNRVIKTLREWIFQQVEPPFLRDKFCEKEEGEQIGIRTLVRILCWFYYNPYLHHDEKRDARTAMTMSNKILGTLKDLASPQRPPLISLTMDTWHELLNCLLRIVSVIVPSSPSGDDGEKNFTRALSVHLFQTLLITWVLASAVCKLPISAELWNHLTEILSERADWEDLIDEWSKVLETTTRALSLNFYHIDLMNAPLDRQKGRKQIKESGESRAKLGTTPAPVTTTSSNTSDSVLTPRELYNICQPAMAETEVPKKPRTNSPTDQILKESPKSRSVSDVDRPRSEIVNPGELDADKRSDKARTPNVEHANGSAGGSTLSKEGVDAISMESASVSSADFGLMEEKDPEKTSLFGDDRKYLTPSPVSGEMVDGSLEDLSEVMLEEEEDRDMTPREESLPGDISPDGGIAWVITWRRMIGCLGNVARIADPAGRLKAVQVLGKITATLQRIRNNLGVSVDGQPTPDHPTYIPPVLYAVPFLLDCLSIESPSFKQSRLAAFKILSSIFLDKHEAPICDAWIIRFHNAAMEMLQEGSESEKDAVLSKIGPIILSTECCELQNLIPACSKAASDVFLSYPATSIVYSVHIAAFPLMGQQYLPGKFCDIQGESMDILTTAVINPGKLQWKVLGQAINGITVFLLNQIDSEGQPHPSFQSAVDALVKNLHNSSEVIAAQVCEAIALILFRIFRKNQGSVNKSVHDLGLRLMDVLGYEFYRRSGELAGGKNKGICERILCCLIEICCKTDCEGSHSDLLPSLSQVLSGKNKGSLKSCAQASVGQLLSAKSQNPLPQFNVAQFGSVETDPESTSVWISHSKSGQTISAAPTSDRTSTAVTRTLGGKHLWSVSEMLTNNSPRKPPEQYQVNKWLLDQSRTNSSRKTKPVKSSEETSADPFGMFLKNLIRASPECQMQRGESQMLPHQQEVEASMRSLSLHPCSPSLEDSKSATLKAGIRRDTAQSQSLGPWWNLIGDLSMIAWEKQTLFAQLRENPEKLNRELKHLDHLQSRETFKVAVMYVAQGQEDKTSILSNVQGSKMFEKFVSGLGWEVDLKTHCGYMGGLPTEGTTPYYTDLNTQLIFHVSTRLSSMDMTKKTKHLGNDEVHIVWSEHYRDYRRAIFPTEFCDVLIVIYPMRHSGLFRVHLECRDEESMVGLGPLFHGAVLSWNSLAFLIRATAMNACRMKRRSMQGWEPSWEQRTRAMQDIRDQMAQPSSFSDLLVVFFGGAREEVSSTKSQLKLPRVRDESGAVVV